MQAADFSAVFDDASNDFGAGVGDAFRDHMELKKSQQAYVEGVFAERDQGRKEKEFEAMTMGREIEPQSRMGIEQFGGLKNAVKEPERSFQNFPGRF